MTLVMQDSIDVSHLTPGADAYLGYVDGRWPTFDALKARFPGKRRFCPRGLLTQGSTVSEPR